MYAWAGTQTQPGGLYRVRATNKPMFLPTGLHATRNGLRITFTEPLDRASASDPSHYSVETWSLKRTANYGSDHYDEKKLRVTRASVSKDGTTVALTIPDIRPTWGMAITFKLKGSQGAPSSGRFTTRSTISRIDTKVAIGRGPRPGRSPGRSAAIFRRRKRCLSSLSPLPCPDVFWEDVDFEVRRSTA